MHFFRKVTDLETGEVYRLSIGEHLTFTEAAQRFQVSRSTLIKALLHLRLCQREYDPIAKSHRHRLHPDAVKKGLGFRIMGKHGPFDRLSPTALEWIEEDLKALIAATELDPPTREAFLALGMFERDPLLKMDIEGKVYWLMNNFPNIPVCQMAKRLGVSERIVHRYLTRRWEQLRRSSERRSLPLFKDAPPKVEPEGPLRDNAGSQEVKPEGPSGLSLVQAV